MPMTVVVTRNVEERVRGFLASCMLELASGVYTSSRMNVAVRERITIVLEKWGVGSRGDSATIIWASGSAPGGQEYVVLGETPRTLVKTSGVVLTRLPLTEAEVCSLKNQVDPVPF